MSAGAVEFVIIGEAELQKAFDLAGARAQAGLSAAIGAWLSNVMADAVEITPLDTGALRGSAYVSDAVVEGTVVTRECGYGGPAKDYAVVQHDDLRWDKKSQQLIPANPPMRHEVGQSHFLENAVEQHKETMAEDVGRILIDALAGKLPPSMGRFPPSPG